MTPSARWSPRKWWGAGCRHAVEDRVQVHCAQGGRQIHGLQRVRPVRHDGKTLGLVVRETNMATRESNGRYESESINAGKQLYEMIPVASSPTSTRS